MYDAALNKTGKTAQNTEKAKRDKSAKTRIFEVIYRKFYENIYHECLKSIEDEDEIPDHVHEILMRCYTGMAKYDNTKSMLSTWVMKIARNYLADYGRRMMQKTELICCEDDFFDLHTRQDEYGAEESSTGRRKNGSDVQILRRALKRMKTRHRNILKYRAEGVSFREISVRMNISEKAAMEIHRRALDRLKKLFWEEKGNPLACGHAADGRQDCLMLK